MAPTPISLSSRSPEVKLWSRFFLYITKQIYSWSLELPISRSSQYLDPVTQILLFFTLNLSKSWLLIHGFSFQNWGSLSRFALHPLGSALRSVGVSSGSALAHPDQTPTKPRFLLGWMWSVLYPYWMLLGAFLEFYNSMTMYLTHNIGPM